MTDDRIWMVRAGRGGRYVDDFLEESHVAIGWNEIGQVVAETHKSELVARLEAEHPNASAGAIGVWAAQIARYYQDLLIGDSVTTYDPGVAALIPLDRIYRPTS